MSYIFAFLIVYFCFILGTYLTLKGLIQKGKVLGDINKTIGVAAGFFREYDTDGHGLYHAGTFKRNILIVWKRLTEDFSYNVAAAVLKK